MITLTKLACEKIREIAQSEGIVDLSLRAKVIGGGCAGFSYDLYFEDAVTDLDEKFEIEDIKLAVDPLSFQYLLFPISISSTNTLVLSSWISIVNFLVIVYSFYQLTTL